MKRHLQERGLQLERYKVYLNRWTATFPLYTPNGKMIGYQQYRPTANKTKKNNPKNGRYYTRCSEGYLPIWGFETLHYRDDIVFTCEGVFKAAQLHRLNLPALALLGNDSKSYMNQVHLLNRRVVAICDPDDAGKKMAKIGHEFYDMDGRYLDEMFDNEIVEFLREKQLYN